MRAYLIIIFQVRQQYVTEVPLSEHNNVVKAFPSDRTDQPFGVSILPRGAWRRWSVANAHRSKSSDEDIAIGLIAIAAQIGGSPFIKCGASFEMVANFIDHLSDLHNDQSIAPS